MMVCTTGERINKYGAVEYCAIPCPIPDEELRNELRKAGALAVEAFDKEGYGSNARKLASHMVDQVLAKIRARYGQPTTRPAIEPIQQPTRRRKAA